MQIKGNGITFNYRIDGAKGAPWLMFSNSLATSLAMWDAQADALSRSFQVLRYDQRGHGETEAPDGRYPFATLLADAVGLMDALGIAKAHFCGLSLGGATTLGMAETYPDRIDKAIVCDSPCTATPQSAQQWEERIAVAKAGGMKAIAEPTLQRWFPPPVYTANPPFVEKIRAMVLSTPVNGFVGCCHALGNHDFKTAAPTVKRPVLFICGEKDAPINAMRELNKAVAGSKFVEIAGAGHISNIEQPDAFSKAVQDFLKS